MEFAVRMQLLSSLEFRREKKTEHSGTVGCFVGIFTAVGDFNDRSVGFWYRSNLSSLCHKPAMNIKVNVQRLNKTHGHHRAGPISCSFSMSHWIVLQGLDRVSESTSRPVPPPHRIHPVMFIFSIMFLLTILFN